MTLIETCALCGFDSSDYTRQDLLGTLRALAPMWRTMTEGMPRRVLCARPAADTWSAIEYAAHSRDVTATMGRLLHFTLTSDDPRLGPPPETPQPAPAQSLTETITELDQNVARLHSRAMKLTDDEWQRAVVLGEDDLDVRWIVGHAVHDGTHHLRDVGRGLAELGAGAPTQHGVVAQVNASNGGVPKRALLHAVIGLRGLDGDRQAERRHHGRPWQALCLWSAEVIEDLRAEGHSVHPGAAGENITVTGIDWSTARPGVRMRIGTALVEVSAFAEPCSKNAQWFVGGNFRRMGHDLHPGWSRAYAWVLEPGQVAPGDAVVVEP
jgi:MOSC domain-containing protein YiiM